MPDMQLAVSVGDGNRPAYKVLANDGGPDGGTLTELYVGGFPGNAAVEDLDAAVAALGAHLASLPGFSLVSITRLTAAASTL